MALGFLEAPMRNIKQKNTAKRNMSSVMCALSMYSHLCKKMLTFMLVRAWAMRQRLNLSCGIPFLIWMPGFISSLTSVVVWLSQ